MRGRMKTPRPQIPELPSRSESYLSDDSYSNTDRDSTSWHVESDAHAQHRSAEVTGWMCIPKSVVMATALNLKHLQRLERGKPLTILNDNRKMRRRSVSDKTLAYIQCQNITKSPVKKPPTDFIINGCYEDFLDENMTDVSSLKERFGVQTPERYEPVDLSEENKQEIWERYMREKEELKSIESALPSWKRSFLPSTAEVQDVKVRLCNAEKLLAGTRAHYHSRPLTADPSLKSQSIKASELARSRPLSSSSRSFKAMKTSLERKEKISENLTVKRLPGYPPRVVRNRSRRSLPMCNKRPVMTTQTSWFPISFNSEMKGSLVTLGLDSYGYQTVAEYEELCYSLCDGLAVVEQPMEIGDIYKVKILATDRRVGLLGVAVMDPEANRHEKRFEQETFAGKLPRNRLSSKTEEGVMEWKFSYEITNLKQGDHLLVYRDQVGRLKCSVNQTNEQLLVYLDDSKPVLVALCLGLGVTKVQLLGCNKHNRSLLDAEAETSSIINHKNSPFLIQDSSNFRCSFCGCISYSTPANLKLPYACDHIALCQDCCDSNECRLCAAPLCWVACPLCDNRLQSY